MKPFDLARAMGITIWQPHAQAIACGLKQHETRKYSTRHRGPLLIHASKQWTDAELATQARLFAELVEHLGLDDERLIHFCTAPPLRVVVAVADLVAVHKADELAPWLSPVERLLGDYSPGRRAWQLERIVALPEPIECRGAQGLWTPKLDVLEQVGYQLRGRREMVV